MKSCDIFCSATLVVATTIFATPLASQEKSKPAAPPDKATQEKMIQEWMKLSSPGEHHGKLEALVGKWSQVVKTPDGKWVESKGTAEFKLAMGGRFLIEEVKTEFMGQPFEWMGIHGYDNAKKKFVSAWIDNAGTSIDLMDGAFDETGNVITYTGEFDDPVHGKTKAKWIMKIESKDRVITEMDEGSAGSEQTKVLEIIATRTT